jgi:hypothetical protein
MTEHTANFQERPHGCLGQVRSGKGCVRGRPRRIGSDQ